MKISWFIIAIVLGAIFVSYNNRKKIEKNFYASLNSNQLQEELIKILDLILHKHTDKSNFGNGDIGN